MKVQFTLLLLLLASSLETSASDFPCPDEQSLAMYARLQELNGLHPLSRAEPGYSELIELASKRPMDDLILHRACSWLASRTFRTNCSDYGYECPSAGALLMEWPAQINDWIPELRANVPALASCPDAYIRQDPKLPIRRSKPVITSEIIDAKITGWVVLSLDVDEYGKVANAKVTSSTSAQLESPALEAARKFWFQKELAGNRFVPVKDVSAAVYIHYWSVAEAAGCSISYE